MAELGQIVKGREIGQADRTAKYIYHACEKGNSLTETRKQKPKRTKHSIDTAIYRRESMFKKLRRRFRKSGEDTQEIEIMRVSPESLGGFTFNIPNTEKRFRCSRGHEWKDNFQFETSFSQGDWRVDAPACTRCMAEDFQARYPPPEEVKPSE